MIGRCMDGGIGTILVLGWPLSDWAALLLLLVLAVLTVALLAALIGVIASWFRRPAPAGTDIEISQNFVDPVR